MARRDYEALAPAWRGNLHTILSAADAAEFKYGLSWYKDAQQTAYNIAQKTGYRLETAAGVMAALSPGCPWLRNVAETEDFLMTHKAQGRKVLKRAYGVYGKNNKRKAYHIAEGDHPREVLGGMKVRSFYECIMNPENTEFVTVDGHAKCAAYNNRLGIHLVTVSKSEYPKIASAYCQVASERGLIPCQAQAIIWLAWRRIHGISWLPDERQIVLFDEENLNANVAA